MSNCDFDDEIFFEPVLYAAVRSIRTADHILQQPAGDMQMLHAYPEVNALSIKQLNLYTHRCQHQLHMKDCLMLLDQG